jgi:hypothetical protein
MFKGSLDAHLDLGSHVRNGLVIYLFSLHSISEVTGEFERSSLCE